VLGGAAEIGGASYRIHAMRINLDTLEPDVRDDLAALIQRMSGIRWRVSHKQLILLKDWVSRPFHSPDHAEPHPPCPILRLRRLAFQPSDGRKSSRLSMVVA
jgi:hypothetical protein